MLARALHNLGGSFLGDLLITCLYNISTIYGVKAEHEMSRTADMMGV